jgi:hypothetical protein
LYCKIIFKFNLSRGFKTSKMQKVKIVRKNAFKKRIEQKKKTFKEAESSLKEEVIKIKNRSQAFDQTWLTF